MSRERIRNQIQQHGGIPIPLKDGSRWLFTENDYHQLRAYARTIDPKIDVTIEVIKYRRWCRRNEKKRPAGRWHAIRQLEGWIKRLG